MQNRLAIVNLLFFPESDSYVLIKKRRIIGRCGDIAAAGEDLPRTRAKKMLAWRGRESCCQAAIRCSSLRGDQIGEKSSVRFNAVHVFLPSMIFPFSILPHFAFLR